ncbi:MAG: TRAP transporter substrate-binding protein [Lachnospiraceae bacterium]|nr:TRAP transporter substrate-binding protein [Lachnospiraceae bacterium]
MRLQKAASMTLAAAMVITTLAGCGSSQQAAPSQAEATTAAAGSTAAAETTASAPQKKADTVTLKLANNQPEENATTKAVQWFADEVNKKTDGRIFIEVHNNGELGDAVSCLEQAQYGGMDIIKADLSTMTNFVGEYNALMMPYIYNDINHFWTVHGGDIGMGILRGDAMKEKGLYGLTYYDAGTRCFYNTKKEIHTPEDMKGMLVRVQQSELMMSMVEALGAESVATAYSEVYSALQTGVCDAAENSIVNYLDTTHYEVAPYFVKDDHTMSADILVMSAKTREKLSEDDLKIIDDTALESWEMQKDLWAEAEKTNEEKLNATGKVTITELTDEEAAKFRDACEPIWYSYEGGKYKDLIDQIVAAGK